MAPLRERQETRDGLLADVERFERVGMMRFKTGKELTRLWCPPPFPSSPTGAATSTDADRNH